MRIKDAIRRRIQELCIDRQISLYALSCRCGLAQSTLNNIISGRNNSTTIDTVCKICEGFEISLGEFFDSAVFTDNEQEIL